FYFAHPPPLAPDALSLHDALPIYTSLSPHYRNLAGTAAAQMNAIPATAQVYEEMKKAGIELKVAADLSGLRFITPLDIYGHMLRSEEHTSELQSRENLVCRLLLEK